MFHRDGPACTKQTSSPVPSHGELEHLDADSEPDAISDIQPVKNVTPNVRQTSVILASVRHQTQCSEYLDTLFNFVRRRQRLLWHAMNIELIVVSKRVKCDFVLSSDVQLRRIQNKEQWAQNRALWN